MDIVYWDHSYNLPLIINLTIAVGLLTCLRIFSGMLTHTDGEAELLKKDNPAFGISLAGFAFAVVILLSGVIYGDPEKDMIHSAIAVAVYGAIGVGLMALTRVIFDKFALPHISLRDEIARGNVAVALADAANLLAAAIILRAILVWITTDRLEALLVFLAAFAISQLIFSGTTILRLRIFRFFNKDKSMEEELAKNNIALGLVFAGRKIGTAFAISVASNLVVYEVYDLKSILLPWFAVSIAVIIILKGLSFVAEKIVLFNVNTQAEVLEERNIAVGMMRALIYISLAVLIAEI